MSKSYSLDFVLALSEEQIRTRFPHGLVMHGKRWIPADQDSEGLGHRSLRQLMQEKRRRLLSDRLLDRNPGMSRSDYTDRLDRAMRDEGAAPPKAWTDQNSEERRVHHGTAQTTQSLERLCSERDSLKTLLETYHSLAREKGMDIRSDIRVVERRLEELDRKLGIKRAA